MTWKEVSADVLCAVMSECDGRTIWKPEYFTAIGAPQELVMRSFDCKESGTFFKDKIQDLQTGNDVNQCAGIDDWDLMHEIAKAFDLECGRDYDAKMGRFSQIREIAAAVKRKLGLDAPEYGKA